MMVAAAHKGVEAMVNFLIRRLFYMVITLFFASIIGFLLIELPPGSYLDSEISRLRKPPVSAPKIQRAPEGRWNVSRAISVAPGRGLAKCS